MQSVEELPLVWCDICRAVRRVVEVSLPETSWRRWPGLTGATLECERCDTALLTIYAREDDG